MDQKPFLFQIRRLGERNPLPQLFYASELIKSKITPESHLKFEVKDRLGNKSKLKFKRIRKEEWVTNSSFKQ